MKTNKSEPVGDGSQLSSLLKNMHPATEELREQGEDLAKNYKPGPRQAVPFMPSQLSDEQAVKQVYPKALEGQITGWIYIKRSDLDHFASSWADARSKLPIVDGREERTHEPLEWGTNCLSAPDRGPHECNGKCGSSHKCLRCECLCLCQWCNMGNPRCQSSVSDRWIHTDTPVGRITCIDEPAAPKVAETQPAISTVPELADYASRIANRNEAKLETQPATEELQIWYHGTSAENASAVRATGFLADTWFSRDMGSAYKFGGPHVFLVRVSFDDAPLGWQAHSLNHIPATAIIEEVFISIPKPETQPVSQELEFAKNLVKQWSNVAQPDMSSDLRQAVGIIEHELAKLKSVDAESAEDAYRRGQVEMQTICVNHFGNGCMVVGLAPYRKPPAAPLAGRGERLESK